MKTTKEVMEQQTIIIRELRKNLSLHDIYQGQIAVIKAFLEKIHAPPKNTVYH